MRILDILHNKKPQRSCIFSTNDIINDISNDFINNINHKEQLSHKPGGLLVFNVGGRSHEKGRIYHWQKLKSQAS